MAKRLLLVRHGESVWNAEGRWQGSADPPLSDAGRAQAAALAEFIRDEGIDHIVTSDLDRAHETARIVAAALGVPVGVMEDRLRERDVGEISGLTRAEIEAKFPGLLEKWRTGELTKMPGGEDDITPRVSAAIEALASAPDGSVVLVVTHGGVIGAIDRWLGTEYRRVGNVQGRWLTVDDDGRIAFDAHFGVSDLDDTTAVVL
ncbi:MAG: histidine phosphatase family protein [Actinobacteria bacterium]|nr:histidine phosphatase family protein [Actinomycetota bacterium]MBA3655677.1 histidine phosphatase family protein [Actinomycetota bacterium]